MEPRMSKSLKIQMVRGAAQHDGTTCGKAVQELLNTSLLNVHTKKAHFDVTQFLEFKTSGLRNAMLCL